MASGPGYNIDVNPVEICNEDNDCKIEKLNDDCLLHVFSFLPLRQRIRNERVCKRWQDVALRSLEETVKNISSTDFEALHESDKELKGFLQHIVKHCTSLQYLEIINISPLEEIDFSSELLKLKELKVINCSAKDIGLQNVFRMCPNITSLTISDNPQIIIGKCLQSLNLHYLKEVAIIHCYLVMNVFIAGLERMKNLKSLTLIFDDRQKLNTMRFSQVLRAVPSLEHLVFSGCEIDWTPNGVKNNFGVPKNLISLDVHNNSLVNNALLKEVSENCANLEHLNVSGCCKVTHVGIQTLVNIPNLKYLYMTGIRYKNVDCITDYELELLASRRKLVKLEVRHNKRITDEGCAKILKLCEELVHLDIMGCSHITRETVKLAERVVICRSNNEKLEIVLGGTSVRNSGRWEDLTTNLVLNFSHIWDPYNRSKKRCDNWFHDSLENINTDDKDIDDMDQHECDEYD